SMRISSAPAGAQGWNRRVSNPRPSRCHRDALPTAPRPLGTPREPVPALRGEHPCEAVPDLSAARGRRPHGCLAPEPGTLRRPCSGRAWGPSGRDILAPEGISEARMSRVVESGIEPPTSPVSRERSAAELHDAAPVSPGAKLLHLGSNQGPSD